MDLVSVRHRAMKRLGLIFFSSRKVWIDLKNKFRTSQLHHKTSTALVNRELVINHT